MNMPGWVRRGRWFPGSLGCLLAAFALAASGCPMSREDNSKYETTSPSGRQAESRRSDSKKDKKQNKAPPKPKKPSAKDNKKKNKKAGDDDYDYFADSGFRGRGPDPYYDDPYAGGGDRFARGADPYGDMGYGAGDPYARQPYPSPDYGSGGSYGSPPPSVYGDRGAAPGQLGIRTEGGSPPYSAPAPSPGYGHAPENLYGDYYGDRSGSMAVRPPSPPPNAYSGPAPAPVPPPGLGGAVHTEPLPPLTSDAAPRNAGPSPELDQARRLVLDKRYEEALPLLERETALRPQDGEAWRWHGDCLYNMLQFAKAIEAYDRALAVNRSDYYALRGQGFAYLHLGHEYWRAQESARAARDTGRAGEAFQQAHRQYQEAHANLRECVKRNPKDEDALYGRGLAAEGTSRRLFSLADAWLRSSDRETNPARRSEYRNNANQFAQSFDAVVKDGLEAARLYSALHPDDAAPRALAGGLLQRRAILNHYLGRQAQAATDLREAIEAQRYILDRLEADNAIARAAVAECQRYLDGQWPERL